MGLLSFASLSFFLPHLNLTSRMILLASVLVGLYLSIKSGSRTGWINLPFFLIVWTVKFALPTYGRLKALLMLLFLTVTIGVLINANPYFMSKVLNGINEVSSYNWYSSSIEGSANMRISFYRMVVFYFSQSPLKGWGDLGWRELMNSPQIAQYASDYAREFPKHGFHNEILTNSVRSGVLGLISSVALFLLPIIWSIKMLRRAIDIDFKFFSLFILFFMLHMFLAGMTTEVTSLVFLASFLGLTISIFVGESFVHYKINNSNVSKSTC